jgi:hypothetical protein
MEIVKDVNLIAACGLYCGACRQYLKDRCPGCRKNDKAKWCTLRLCVKEKGYSTCAECAEFADVNECRKFNTFFSKIFAVIFNSNRKACIEQIKSQGLEIHAVIMTEMKRHSLSRK